MLDDIIDFFTAGVVGLLGWFFGGRDGFVNVLLTFVVIDYIMGLMAAYSRHELSSSIGFKGIFKKVSIFCLVGVAHVVDVHVLGDTATLRTTVSLFYIANEGISILENADELGIPIPQFLKARLLNIKEQMNSTNQTALNTTMSTSDPSNAQSKAQSNASTRRKSPKA